MAWFLIGRRPHGETWIYGTLLSPGQLLPGPQAGRDPEGVEAERLAQPRLQLLQGEGAAELRVARLDLERGSSQEPVDGVHRPPPAHAPLQEEAEPLHGLRGDLTVPHHLPRLAELAWLHQQLQQVRQVRLDEGEVSLVVPVLEIPKWDGDMGRGDTDIIWKGTMTSYGIHRPIL